MTRRGRKMSKGKSLILMIVLSVVVLFIISQGNEQVDGGILIADKNKDNTVDVMNVKKPISVDNEVIDGDLDIEDDPYGDEDGEDGLSEYRYLNELFSGKKADDINLINKNGRKSVLEMAKAENGIFIEFMAPWCPGCIDAVDELNRLSEITGKRVISMAVDASPEELEEFIEENNSKQDLYFIENYDALENYGVQLIPITFYINGNGIIEGVFSTITPADEIKEVLNI